MNLLCDYENYLRDRYILGQPVRYMYGGFGDASSGASAFQSKQKIYGPDGNEYTYIDDPTSPNAGRYYRNVGGPGGGRVVFLDEVQETNQKRQMEDANKAAQPKETEERQPKRGVRKKEKLNPERKITFNPDASYEELLEKHYPDGNQVVLSDLGYTPEHRRNAISLSDIARAIESNDLTFFDNVRSPVNFNDGEEVVLQDRDGDKLRFTNFGLFEFIKERLEDNNPDEPYQQGYNNVDDALYGYKWVKLPRELRSEVDGRNKTRQINRGVSEAILVLNDFAEDIGNISKYDEVPSNLLTGLVDCYLGIEKTAPHHDDSFAAKKVFLSRVNNFLAGASLARFLANNEDSPARDTAVGLIEKFLEAALSKTPSKKLGIIYDKAKELGFTPYISPDPYNSYFIPADYREPKRPADKTPAESPAQEPEPKDVIARDAETTAPDTAESETTALERAPFDVSGLGLPGSQDSILDAKEGGNRDAAYFIRRDLGEERPQDSATEAYNAPDATEQNEAEGEAPEVSVFIDSYNKYRAETKKIASLERKAAKVKKTVREPSAQITKEELEARRQELVRIREEIKEAEVAKAELSKGLNEFSQKNSAVFIDDDTFIVAPSRETVVALRNRKGVADRLKELEKLAKRGKKKANGQSTVPPGLQKQIENLEDKLNEANDRVLELLKRETVVSARSNGETSRVLSPEPKNIVARETKVSRQKNVETPVAQDTPTTTPELTPQEQPQKSFNVTSDNVAGAFDELRRLIKTIDRSEKTYKVLSDRALEHEKEHVKNLAADIQSDNRRAAFLARGLRLFKETNHLFDIDRGTFIVNPKDETKNIFREKKDLEKQLRRARSELRKTTHPVGAMTLEGRISRLEQELKEKRDEFKRLLKGEVVSKVRRAGGGAVSKANEKAGDAKQPSETRESVAVPTPDALSELSQEKPAKPRPERWTPLKSAMNDDDKRVVENTRKRLNYGLSELAWRLGNAKERGDIQRVKQLVATAANHYLEQARRAYRSHGGTEALAAFDEALGGNGLTVGQLRDRVVDKFRKIAQMEANDLFKFAGERLDEFESFAETDREPIANKKIYLNSIRDKNGKWEGLDDKDSEVAVEDGKPTTLFPDEYFGRRMGSERGLADAVRRALKSMTRKGEYRDSFENGAEYAAPKYNIDTPTRMGRFLAHGYKDSLDGKPVNRDDYSEQRYQELLEKFPSDRESRKLNNLFKSNNREVNKLIKENEDEYKQSKNKSEVVQRVVDGIRDILSGGRQNGSAEAPPSESLRDGTTGEVLEAGGADRPTDRGDGRDFATVIAEEAKKSDIPESRVREELGTSRLSRDSDDTQKAVQSLRNLIQRVYRHDGLSERIKSRVANVFGDTLSTPGETSFEAIGEHDKHLFELVNKLDKAKKKLEKIQERFDENPDSEKLERAVDKAEDVAYGIEDRLIKAVDKFIQPYSGNPKSKRPAPVAKKQPLLSTHAPQKEDKTDWEKDLELQEELKPVSNGKFNPNVEPYSYIPEQKAFSFAGSVTPRYNRDKEIADTIQKWVDEQRKMGRSADIVPYRELFYPGESPNAPGRPAIQGVASDGDISKQIEDFDRERASKGQKKSDIRAGNDKVSPKKGKKPKLSKGSKRK